MGFSYMRSKLPYFKGYASSSMHPSPSPVELFLGNRISPLRNYLTAKFTPQFHHHELPFFSASWPLLANNLGFSHLVFNYVKTTSSLSAQSTSSIVRNPSLPKVFISKAQKSLKYYWPYYVAALVTVTCLRVVRVPYSGKHHLVFPLPELYKSLVAETYLKEMAAKYDKLILPPSHPKTVRATAIARKVGQAMHNGLGLKKDCRIRAYIPSKDNPQLGPPLVAGANRDIRKLREKKIMNFGRRFSTKHLEGREWRIIVVDSPYTYNAMILPDGTMVIYSGLLNGSSDEILAFTIGHEFGHVIAQHFDVRIFRQIITFLLMWPVYQARYPVLRQQFCAAAEGIENFFGRRDELEADHIGMMLAASAGFDPKEASKLWRKRRDSSKSELLSTHPKNSKRAMSMEKPKNMNKAIAVYMEVLKAGK